jgi:hypothetical protein
MDQGTVYLLHFLEPIGNPTNPRAMAQLLQHWALVAANRIADHTAGNGAAIVRAVKPRASALSSPPPGRAAGAWSGSSRTASARPATAPSVGHSGGAGEAAGGGWVPVRPFPPHPRLSAGPGCHQPVGDTPGLRRRLPTSSGFGVGALGRRSPLRTDRTRLPTAHHIHEAAAVAAVGLFAVQLLDLLAVPSPPGQPPPPSGDPGPQAAPDHDDHQGHAQSAQPPPPTSTPRPPATPGHDHHILPFHRLQAASIARRQKAAYPRLRRCRAGTPTPHGPAARLLDGLPPGRRPRQGRFAVLRTGLRPP